MEIKANPLNVAIGGLQKAEERVTKAVDDIQKATVAAGNAVAKAADAGDKVEVSDEAVVADAVRNAVIPADDGSGEDLAKPIVDLLQAKVAYQANAFAVKVTADVESDAARLPKHA